MNSIHGLENPNGIIDEILNGYSDVRYVAIRWMDAITKKQRQSLADSSSSDSDFYEEHMINPAILLLATQRGKIDCGGLDFVIIAYGNFFQLIKPLVAGHISICIQKTSDPIFVGEVLMNFLNTKYPNLI